MAEKADWPSHTIERRPWRQSRRAGTRADRMLAEIDVSIPPLIAALDYHLDPALRDEAAATEFDIAYAEGAAGTRLGALGRFLIQTESVSSSKIEQIDATTRDFARALAGSNANESASSMVAATAALSEMVSAAGDSGAITLDDILAAHHTLMRDDPHDGMHAGALRTVQNWILGSDYSPRGAIHIPPPPELVAEYMTDLLAYANRDDVPALVQAAVVHAQFESIHPFTDGNGRIGRALINAVLRRRGITRRSVVPVATAMVADRDEYFRLINDYRAGRLGPFVASLVRSAATATRETLVTARRFHELPAEWAALVAPRSGSAAEKLIAGLVDHPVLGIAEAMAITATSAPSTYGAMEVLEETGIVDEITGRVRDKVWASSEVLAELDDLARRIAEHVTDARDK